MIEVSISRIIPRPGYPCRSRSVLQVGDTCWWLSVFQRCSSIIYPCRVYVLRNVNSPRSYLICCGWLGCASIRFVQTGNTCRRRYVCWERSERVFATFRGIYTLIRAVYDVIIRCIFWSCSWITRARKRKIVFVQTPVSVYELSLSKYEIGEALLLRRRRGIPI